MTRASDVPVTARVPAESFDAEPSTEILPPANRLSGFILRMLMPVALLVALVGGHQLWSWYAKRQLVNYVDELRSIGEKVSVTEFRSNPVPDAINGAFDLRAAGDVSVPDGDSWQGMFGTTQLALPFNQRELDAIRPIVAANNEIVSRIAVAQNKPAIDWIPILQARGQLPGSGWSGRGSGLFRQRGLTQLLYTGALLAHQDGDDRLAMQRVGELLFIARATSGRPTLMSQEWSLRMYGFALGALHEILPDLSIGDKPGSASQAQVRALLADVQNEHSALESILNCLRIERARYLDSVLLGPREAREAGGVDSILWGEPLPMPWTYSKVERFLTEPVMFTRSKDAVERLSMGMASFQQPSLRDFLDFNDILEPRDDSFGNADPAEDQSLRPLVATLERMGREYYACLARRRVTAVAMAAALYRAEHGDWPAGPDLAGLVPAYIHAIPVDPLSTSGQRIVYATDSSRPRVYSVGDDGIDDGGWPADVGAAPSSRSETALADWVVDLKRQPRPLAPTTRPAVGG